MAEKINVRSIALSLLSEYEELGKYVNLSLNSHKADRLTDSERAQLTALLYTVVEHKLTYEIFAAYEYSNIHLLLNYDFNNVGVYQQYINEIQTLRSMTYIYKEDFEWTTEDKIITLSTCIADKPSNRYLVQGVLINEE